MGGVLEMQAAVCINHIYSAGSEDANAETVLDGG